MIPPPFSLLTILILCSSLVSSHKGADSDDTHHSQHSSASHKHHETVNATEQEKQEYAHMGYVKHFNFVSKSKIRINGYTREHNIKSSHAHQNTDKLTQTDSFLFEFDAFDQRFCFHMHPNYDLFHPNAEAITMDMAGNKLESLSLDNTLAFKGHLMAVKDLLNGDDEFDFEYDCEWASQNPSFESISESYGWSRLIVHNDRPSLHSPGVPQFEGVFIYGEETFSIKTVANYVRNRRPKDIEVKLNETSMNSDIMVFNHNDIKDGQKEHFCGSGDESSGWGHEEARGYFNTKSEILFKYGSNPADSSQVKLSKRVYSGCPLSKKIIYMAVVADCTYYKMYGSDADKAKAQIIANWNSASAIYEQSFNIFLGLLSVQVLTSCSAASSSTAFNLACSDSYTITNRLSDFSKWRGTQDASAGLWHLMSNCSTGPTIGIAWLNMVCQTEAFSQTNSDGTKSYVSGVGITTVSSTEYVTIAHEIGHNFGATHDCTSDLCSGCNTNPCAKCCPCQSQCDCVNSFIMNPTAVNLGATPKFSPCSQTNICNNNLVFGSCLESPGSRTAMNSGICGNGLKDANEECDCGGADDCAADKCCFANCTLKAGAKCSDKNSGCCKNCTVLPANTTTVCRPSEGECDIPEICAGDANCPTDLFKTNGIKCGNSTDLTCATGACTSRLAQCKAYRPDALSDCAAFSGQCAMFCNIDVEGCIKVSGYYREGSLCGNAGTCVSNKCTDSDFFGSVTEWILTNQNLSTAILIVFAVGMFALGNYLLKSLKADVDKRVIKQARLEENELDRIARIDKQRRQKMRMNRLAAEVESESPPQPQRKPRSLSVSNKSGQGFDPRSPLQGVDE